MILATGALKIDANNQERLLSTQTQASCKANGGTYPGKKYRDKRYNIYDYCIRNMVRKY